MLFGDLLEHLDDIPEHRDEDAWDHSVSVVEALIAYLSRKHQLSRDAAKSLIAAVVDNIEPDSSPEPPATRPCSR